MCSASSDFNDQNTYMYRASGIQFVFGSKFLVSFGVIPIIRSAKKNLFLSDRRYRRNMVYQKHESNLMKICSIIITAHLW